MKPTQEQLNDPAWWDENVDPAHDYAFTTGPDWQGNNKYVGSVEFANEDGETGCEESLVLGRDSWVPLAKRPTKAAFVPEVGMECELWWGGVYQEPVEIIQYRNHGCKVVFWRMEQDCVDSAELPTAQFRPIKSERDLFVEAAQLAADTTQSTVFGKLYDAGCRFVETDK